MFLITGQTLKNVLFDNFANIVFILYDTSVQRLLVMEFVRILINIGIKASKIKC